MAEADISDETRVKAALEGGYLMNEAIRELVAPRRVLELTRQWEEITPLPITAISAVRNMILRNVIVNVYRLHEARDEFLCPWILADTHLRDLGFPPLEEFFGSRDAWSAFETLRHQYGGHAPSKWSDGRRPGTLIPAAALGKAIRRAGLRNLPAFLERVTRDLAPGVETVRDKLDQLYPQLRSFIQQYAVELETAMNEG